MGTEDDITNWGLSKKKSKSAMNQQRGFTLLEMMLVLALVAITASVVLFTSVSYTHLDVYKRQGVSG